MALNIEPDARKRILLLANDVAAGDLPMADAITAVQSLLNWSRDDAMTMMHASVGRLYSKRQYESAIEQSALLPGIRKSWQYGGSPHHPGHLLIAGQGATIPLQEPFEIVDPRTGKVDKLRYPRDPEAGEEHSIHCGCMMIVHPPDARDVFSRPLPKAGCSP
jgi:hypothetical protein